MAGKKKTGDFTTENFNDLLTPLVNSGLQRTNTALYNCLSRLLERLTIKVSAQRLTIVEVVGQINNLGSTVIVIQQFNDALKDLVWLLGQPVPTDPSTSVLVLPNARELLAGIGITFDDSIPNQRTVNATGAVTLTETFITEQDETATLPNSFQLLPGTNITFDTSVPNKLTINSTGGGSALDHVVMSDGAIPTPSPVNDGFGNFIYIPYSP